MKVNTREQLMKVKRELLVLETEKEREVAPLYKKYKQTLSKYSERMRELETKEKTLKSKIEKKVLVGVETQALTMTTKPLCGMSQSELNAFFRIAHLPTDKHLGFSLRTYHIVDEVDELDREYLAPDMKKSRQRGRIASRYQVQSSSMDAR